MKKVFPVLFILSLAFTACSDDKANLKVQLNKGDVFDFELITSNKMDQSSMGKKIEMVTDMIQYGTIEVKEVTSDKHFKMRLIYTRAVQDMKMSAPEPNEMHIDTDNADSVQSEETLDVMQSLKLLVNKPFDFTMNERGEVLDCQSKEFETAMAELVKEVPMMKMLGEQFSTESQKTAIQSFFVVFPEGKATEGTTWTTSSTGLSTSYPIKMENTYTLKKIDENSSSLVSSGTVKVNKDAKGMMAMMVKMMELGGDVTSEVKIDSKTGMPIQNKQVTKVKGSVSMFGTKMPIETEGTTTFSMKKK